MRYDFLNGIYYGFLFFYKVKILLSCARINCIVKFFYYNIEFSVLTVSCYANFLTLIVSSNRLLMRYYMLLYKVKDRAEFGSLGLENKYSVLFTLRVSFDFLRILRRVKSGTLRVGKRVVL